MVQWHLFGFAFGFTLSLGIPFGPTMRNTVMSAIQDSADFAIRIHPPVQDTDETLASLAAMEDFADAKQRLLDVHKAKIRELVAAAFEPIHALLLHAN
ncbi:hypothetical protein BdWA1_001594 [Babesia duncani]|uniref:Uncharacterized protein n=1 Tax=Babesia duncani TaxID=323732 RepID=A0AAD9PK73_9APIC|nr:hypothetical protein BdWA1_001594 [Babesia duncani]